MNDTIETTTRNKETPFNGWNKINRAIKTFETHTKIKRRGEILDLQDYLNENNKDCTIYDVYKTYRGDMKLTAEAMNKLTHKVSDELTQITDLRTAMEVLKATERSWKDLPLEVRKEFGNNINEFQRNGLKWANKKIEAVEAERKRLEDLRKQEQLKALQQAEGEVNNG